VTNRARRAASITVMTAWWRAAASAWITTTDSLPALAAFCQCLCQIRHAAPADADLVDAVLPLVADRHQHLFGIVALRLNICHRQLDLQLGELAVGGGEHQEDQDHQQHINERDQVDLGFFFGAGESSWQLPLLAQGVEVPCQALGCQFQRQQVLVNPGTEIAPENQRREWPRSAECGVVQRHRDAVRQLGRVATGGPRGRL
jgi:hypothetical protein